MVNQILAAFFEKFKSKNQKAFAAFVVVITGVYILLSSGEFTALFGTDPIVARILEIVTVVYAALKGVHTSYITKDGK